MLSGSLGQSIRPFKAVRSFDSHLPIFGRARSSNGHAPLSWFVTQGVLCLRNNVPAQLRVPEILQIDRHSHRTVILLKSSLSLCQCKPVKAARSGAVQRAVEQASENRKGCDIGYALAIGSCEGANSVETCTVTAPDVITAFAAPNPNCPSQDQSVFSGLVALRVAPVSRSLSLLRTGKVLIKPTLSAVDVCKLKSSLHRCQCFFRSLPQTSVHAKVENRNESQQSGKSMQENLFV